MRRELLQSVTYDSGEMAQLKIINEVLSRAGTREKGRFNASCAVHEIHVLRINLLKLMMHRWKRVCMRVNASGH